MTLPPGPPPWGAPPPAAPAQPYRPATEWAVLALVSAGLVTVLELVEAVLAFPAAAKYRDAARTGTDSADIFTAYEIMAAFVLVVFLFGYVATCLWLQRVRRNAEALRPWSRHVHGRGWVWGSWICPVVNLWFPFQVVRDVKNATGSRRANPMLGVWWGSWLAYLVSNQVAAALIPSSGPPDETAIAWLVPMEIANALLCSLALACWVGIVLGVLADQREAAAHPQAPPPPPAFPPSPPSMPPVPPGEWPAKPPVW